MSAVIRVVDCSFSPLRGQVILSVDVMYPDNSLEDRNYLIVADPEDVDTKEKLHTYVEQDITSQRKPMPNWSGESWRAVQV